jgi:uncharacterized SAM-binding protein YcdF (DUF218 family)
MHLQALLHWANIGLEVMQTNTAQVSAAPILPSPDAHVILGGSQKVSAPSVYHADSHTSGVDQQRQIYLQQAVSLDRYLRETRSCTDVCTQ